MICANETGEAPQNVRCFVNCGERLKNRQGIWYFTKLRIESLGPKMEKNYSIILSKETWKKIDDYSILLKNGGKCGSNLSRVLSNESLESRNALNLLGALLDTKYPRIFAESAIFGDGSDWTLTELDLLGDISIGMSVTIYDNGAHQNPHIHDLSLIHI